ncbi:MAG: hypothetical protein IPJ30_12730 [Acidobacteria bacterium]|nr:hypothetical protein [Acidobacteriota bacterium]
MRRVRKELVEDRTSSAPIAVSNAAAKTIAMIATTNVSQCGLRYLRSRLKSLIVGKT